MDARRGGLLYLTATLLCLSIPVQVSAEHDWTEQIAAFKPLVVNIETSREIVFSTENQGTAHGTGFVVDAERGIVATNAHVIGTSPSYVKIYFHDGSFTEAKALYYDPTHDFGFYRIDPKALRFELRAVSLGAWRDLALGEELLLIGNNDREEYSIKFGTVAKLNVNKGDRHSSYIHTTFDRTGGSSGSPVWNAQSEVVGIHARGTNTSSFELPIEYITDALGRIQQGIPIQRGEIGLDLHLLTIGQAIRHFSLPEPLRDQIVSSSAETPRVIQVETTIRRTTGQALFQPGDIVYRLNGELLRDDLYRFDAILNGHVGRSVALDVYRHGKPLRIEVQVDDMEKEKVRRFVRFAGAVFHDITTSLRRRLDFEADGVYMSYASRGSSFAHLGRRAKNGALSVIVSEMNGLPIRNLDDFYEICTRIAHSQHTYVIRRDAFIFDQSMQPRTVTVNLKYGPLGIFAWNAETLDWDKEAGDG